MDDFRSNYLDTLEFDMDYQDLLAMERSCIREFIDQGQASILYLMWNNIDKEEYAVREKMFPNMFEHDTDYSDGGVI